MNNPNKSTPKAPFITIKETKVFKTSDSVNYENRGDAVRHELGLRLRETILNTVPANLLPSDPELRKMCQIISKRYKDIQPILKRIADAQRI